MASAKITTLAFYRWMKDNDDDLFSLLDPPEGINKEVLVNNILMQSAPFEVVYSDPEIMQALIGAWSDASADKWQRWMDAWEYASEFNPLENFDRSEHEVIQNSGTDTNGNTQTRNLAGSDNRTANLSNAETVNLTDLNTKDLTTLDTQNLTQTDTKDLTTLDTRAFADNETKNLTTEKKVSAYDVSTYSPKEQETISGTDNISHTGTDTIKNTGTDTITNTGTDTIKNTGTDTMAHTGTDTTLVTGTDNHATTDTGTVTDSGSFTHGHKIERDARYHGNIGVTSLSTLLNDYDEVAEKWDMYAVITNDFLREFCILVY